MRWWWDVTAICVGASSGALLRWALGLGLNPLFSGFPLGTLAANLLGGFLMGIVLAVVSVWSDMPVALRLLLTTGFLGGLTTFSSFSGEVFNLFQRQANHWAFAAIACHVLGSLAMTWAGWSVFQVFRH